MPAMTKINFGLSRDFPFPSRPLPPRPLPPRPQPLGPMALDFNIEELPPMRFHEEAWYVLQGTGYNYLHEQRFREKLSDEEVINRLFIDFHKIPGDVALKVVQKAFNLDFENKDVARALYEASLKVRVTE